MSNQALKKAPPGGSTEPPLAKAPALKREVPESASILKDLETAQKPKQSQESKRKSILERCGCL